MYGILTYIYLNVGKYTISEDSMGYVYLSLRGMNSYHCGGLFQRLASSKVLNQPEFLGI